MTLYRFLCKYTLKGSKNISAKFFSYPKKFYQKEKFQFSEVSCSIPLPSAIQSLSVNPKKSRILEEVIGKIK